MVGGDTLLPGWRDTIVGNLGGAGFVYLLPHDGHLLQLDLYESLAPPCGSYSGAHSRNDVGHYRGA